VTAKIIFVWSQNELRLLLLAASYRVLLTYLLTSATAA